MLTINIQWLDYKENCVPDTTPDNVVSSVRSTFYAGSLSVLTILRELQGSTPQQVNKVINDMFDEMTEFSRELNKG